MKQIRTCSLPGLRIGEAMVECAPAAGIRDTTDAGDLFNSGYLVARLSGMNPLVSCRLGRRVAGEVTGRFRALARKDGLTVVHELIDKRAGTS